MKFKSKKYISFFIISLFLLSNIFIYKNLFAASNIDETLKYAWGEDIGWINFNPDNGNVNVSYTEITGYAYSQNYGWINLSPTNGGVLNNGKGILSGNAWGENIGWINFSGVTINDNGEFLGYATTENFGRINFNCINESSCSSSDFKVKTSWNKGSVDISLVDSNDNVIENPTFNLSVELLSMSPQTISSFFGNDDQKIRISNTTNTPSWTASVAPTDGIDAVWSNGLGDTYSFNDTNNGGKLTIDPSIATYTASKSGNTNINLGTRKTFLKNVIDSITLASSDQNTETNLYWDLKNIKIEQYLPASQAPGDYVLDMTLTIIEN